MSEHLGELLAGWPFDPNGNVRVLRLPEGREILQVRVDQGAFQGILQMDLDGRPDGGRPHGQRFCLDFQRTRLREHIRDHGSAEGFALSHEECEELFEESYRIYQRYVFLLQLQDYARVVRDTERNMTLFRFVNRHAEKTEDKDRLEKWWPYIIRLHAEARAMHAVGRERYDRALEIIRAARGRIEDLKEVRAAEFDHERKRSFEALEDMEKSITENRPMTPEKRLEKQLGLAVENEEFEKAAVLRDRLREMRADDSVPRADVLSHGHRGQSTRG